MKKINEYILEKLRLNDKDISKNHKLKYENIYDVHTGDMVLCILYEGKNGKNQPTVSLHTCVVSEIYDDTIIVGNTRISGRVFDNIEFKFNDHTLSTKPIRNTFAIYKNGGKWAGLIHKDVAKILIDKEFNLTSAPFYKKNYFNGYKLMNGINGEKLLKEILDELNNN